MNIEEAKEICRKEIANTYAEGKAKAISTVLSELDKKDRQLKIKNEYLSLIWQIGYDYDGCNTVKSLQELIDELLDLSIKAKQNDDKSVMYIGARGRTDIKMNILYEEVEEK